MDPTENIQVYRNKRAARVSPRTTNSKTFGWAKIPNNNNIFEKYKRTKTIPTTKYAEIHSGNKQTINNSMQK